MDWHKDLLEQWSPWNLIAINDIINQNFAYHL